jgi:uncharacterized protein YecE (DUF72 family)
MENSRGIHIGTSGWHYDHWRGPFYPEDLSKDNFLSFYADRFQTVEINNSFYQLPTKGTLEKWRDGVQSGFVFAVKASRYITHMKKLKDPERTLSPFLEVIQVLKPKLGPILFQLPPRWGFNLERLKAFLDVLPAGHKYAFELRNPSWHDPRAYEAMAERGAAFCMYELAGTRSPKEVTAGFVYIRLHGPDGAYQGQYSTESLSGWAGAISAWARQGREVFCYFDNDEAGYAPRDALRLQEMLKDG